jgi:cobalamin biosynthesis Mg chelatase CobN
LFVKFVVFVLGGNQPSCLNPDLDTIVVVGHTMSSKRGRGRPATSGGTTKRTPKRRRGDANNDNDSDNDTPQSSQQHQQTKERKHSSKSSNSNSNSSSTRSSSRRLSQSQQSQADDTTDEKKTFGAIFAAPAPVSRSSYTDTHRGIIRWLMNKSGVCILHATARSCIHRI